MHHFTLSLTVTPLMLLTRETTSRPELLNTLVHVFANPRCGLSQRLCPLPQPVCPAILQLHVRLKRPLLREGHGRRLSEESSESRVVKLCSNGQHGNLVCVCVGGFAAAAAYRQISASGFLGVLYFIILHLRIHLSVSYTCVS